MNIAIFGTGYVGLVSAACFADVGHTVVCVDVDEKKITNLQKGVIPIYEPGLESLVVNNYEAGRLKFTTDSKEAVEFGDIIFIAVGTPPREDGSANLAFVSEVAKTIGQYMNRYKIIVNKSTVPVGTAEMVQFEITRALRVRDANFEFDVCSNPEFLKEGAAIEDFTRAARIIVGTDSEEVRRQMRECYAPYIRNHEKLMFMDIRAAELTKYAANAMLATKISFMNEMAAIAERLNVDIEQVRHGIGSDPRIGFDFIYAGCGYGGSCFPKDVRALIQASRSVGCEAQLLESVEDVNGRQKNVLFSKLRAAFSGELENKTVAVWGLSFKPNTDDMREAPSINLIRSLLQSGARVRAYDPVAMIEAERVFGKNESIIYASSRDAAIVGADALVICTEWKEFRTINFDSLKARLGHPLIVDGRNLYNPKDLKKYGFKYYGVGRGDSLGGAEFLSSSLTARKSEELKINDVFQGLE